YVAAASKAGARILPETHADVVRHDGTKVTGVDAHITRARARYSVSIAAPVVVLAAGALESPMLWFRSRLPDPGVAGWNLHLNPYAVISGIFAEPIEAWEGVPQSYVVDEFLNLDKQIEGGAMILAASAQPIAASGLLPGLGAEHRRLMQSYAKIASV